MKPALSTILKEAAKQDTFIDKVNYIKRNDSPALRSLVAHIFDPRIKFALPEGNPPYSPSQFDTQMRLYTEIRKLYIWVEGVGPQMPNVKREKLFIDLLEAVDPEDAKVLLSMKDKKSPYEGLTPEVAYAAFPELFPT
jgi:Family of unknown function (DUF6433)